MQIKEAICLTRTTRACARAGPKLPPSSFQAGEQSKPARGPFAFATARQQPPLLSLQHRGAAFLLQRGSEGLLLPTSPGVSVSLRGENSKRRGCHLLPLSLGPVPSREKKERGPSDGLIGRDKEQGTGFLLSRII